MIEKCINEMTCPSVTEGENGDFYVVGRLPTPEEYATAPDRVAIGDGEVLVIVPRDVMLNRSK